MLNKKQGREMKIIIRLSLLAGFFISSALAAQPWQQNDAIFNSSGVPSLPFSQPRFADLDGDGDMDMILGSINDAPFYVENIGTATSPSFAEGDDIFAGISSLDAEMAVCADLDNDGDLDLISGGFSGLNYFENTGTVASPSFQIVSSFFAGLSAGLNPVPDLADVDADNDLDLVVGFSESGSVKIYLNTGTVSAAQFSEDDVIEIGDVGLYAYPHFCDLDADNDQDIVVGRDAYGFVYYQNIGTPQSGLWEVNAAVFAGMGEDTYWNSPGLTDLNGDGTIDLVFGTAAGPLHYYENNGTVSMPFWQENTTLFGGVIDVGGASNPFFYDFDDDNDLDMVCGSQMGDIKYYQNVGTAFAPAWLEDSSYFASIDHSIYSAITLGDVDDDGLPDAIVGDLNGNFYFHRNTGSGFFYDTEVLASVALGGWSTPRLVDMDYDDDLDIIAGNESGNLFYFENQGTISVPNWVEVTGFFGNIDVGTNCVPTVGDLDLNNIQDVITGNMWGDVQFFMYNEGTWMENLTPVAGISGGQNATPALADLDNDGDLDLALGDYDGTFSYYENLHFAVGSDPELPPIPDFKLSNYPNPFNPETTISFSINTENTGTSTLVIYNVKGQSVKTLISMVLPVGEHSVLWNGTDDNGKSISSGIYFYKLKTADFEKTRKMILVK